MVSSVILISACSNQEESLKTLGLEDLTSKEILTQLADGSIEPEEYAISVYDHKMIIFTQNNQFELPMPENYFYLSVAPYINETHPCTIHNATGCRGEMIDEEIYIEFVDTDGNVILSETVSTQANGFIDLWLPRDKEGTLIIEYGDLSSSKYIETYPEEPTCETTMRLT